MNVEKIDGISSTRKLAHFFEEHWKKIVYRVEHATRQFWIQILTRVDLAPHDTYVEMQSDRSKMMEQFIRYYYYIHLGEIKLEDGISRKRNRACPLMEIEMKFLR